MRFTAAHPPGSISSDMEGLRDDGQEAHVRIPFDVVPSPSP